MAEQPTKYRLAPEQRPPGARKRAARWLRTVRAFAGIGLGTGLMCVLATPTQAQLLRDVQIETPREYGYVVGDELVHRVSILLQDGVELDTERLPESGRINLWLELDVPRAERDGQRWVVELPYRLINRVERSTALVVPQQFLETTGGSHSVSVLVPEWSFTQNPVVPAQVTQIVADHDVRADRLPLPIAPVRARIAMWVALAVAALAGAALAWIYLIEPWLRPRARPFAEAMVKLRALPGEWDEGVEKHALQTLHGALNETAGHALFSSGLDGFLQSRPEFAPLGPRIARLFARSNTLFFESGDAREALSLEEIAGLCRDCLAVERRR